MKSKTCAIAAFQFLLLFCSAHSSHSADFASLKLARESIKAQDLRKHINVMASDTFEGREAGSQGGRAIGVYIGKELQRLKLQGGGDEKGYYQEFGNQFRNIFAIIPGSDPKLKEEYIVIGAHYDHVGYGTPRNSRGPIGYIHNGADDNASGAAGLLEVIEAFVSLGVAQPRSILFAFWDAEEKGLLGSKHWVQDPTIPLEKVRFSVNMDMIGRLRKNTLLIYGYRTAPGLRRMLSLQNRSSDMLFQFKPEMIAESDHYPFYENGIPVVMLHTGKHDDYHRPSDDVDKLNYEGIQQVSRLLFEITENVATQPTLPAFRQVLDGEVVEEDGTIPETFSSPPRLGLSWDSEIAKKGIIQLKLVSEGSPADIGGLQAGDKILKFAGHAVDQFDFRQLVVTAKNPVTVIVEREGESKPLKLKLQLDGEPVKIGIEWRVDEVEPESVTLKKIILGSPAYHAGLHVQDRVYEIDGQKFGSSEEFQKMITSRPSPIKLLVERRGRIRERVLKLTPEPNEMPETKEAQTNSE